VATDAYLTIDGVKGESLDSEYKDKIEILSFSHSMTQPASATASSAGGGTVGRTQHGDFVITKYMDLASPKLYELCCGGKPVASVTLDLLRSSGDSRVKYMSIAMKEVVVSQVTSSGGGSDLPTESVAFNYGSIVWTYTQQKRKDGSKGGNAAAGWDLTANKAAA